MKVTMTAIATLGAMTTFAGSTLADVSIGIGFESRPSINTYQTYESYSSNIQQPVYRNFYQRTYNHNYQPNVGSRVIVREMVPSQNYGNSWHYPNAQRANYPTNCPMTNQSVYNPNLYNVNLGDRYIVEQRIIRVR